MPRDSRKFVVCLDNEGYRASLEPRKIYVALADPVAKKHNLLRVIDESGEDYLYPNDMFAPVEISAELRKALLAA